jgi:hypothetical protein
MLAADLQASPSRVRPNGQRSNLHVLADECGTDDAGRACVLSLPSASLSDISGRLAFSYSGSLRRNGEIEY